LLADPSAVGVLKILGGYTRLVDSAIEERLGLLVDNPRAAGRIDALRTALRTKIPEIRQCVQAVITRMAVVASPEVAKRHQAGKSVGLGPGNYPELEIHAPSLRLAGRVDLLTVDGACCEITDYKTGRPDGHYEAQLRMYALIWSHDEEKNPGAMPVRRLVLSYPSRDVSIAPPDTVELEAMATQMTAQIGIAEEALAERPPPARPEPTMCRLCGVRQLCDAYWSTLVSHSSEGGLASDGWFDFEGAFAAQNGSRSWLLAQTTKPVLLLRTPREDVPFAAGERIRLLNLRREDDDESPLPVAIFTQLSEAFVLADRG
jgi:CRISPR/Cas system-associated exonuclease Cas4 (RecB family)